MAQGLSKSIDLLLLISNGKINLLFFTDNLEAPQPIVRTFTA
jgi:hypothetical protein